MFQPKVKIHKALFERARRAARRTGFSSVEELVAHALEKELARLERDQSEQEIQKRLKGLGYIS